MIKIGKDKLGYRFCKNCEKGYWSNTPFFLSDFKTRIWYCPLCGSENTQKRNHKAPRDPKTTQLTCMVCQLDQNLYFDTFHQVLHNPDYSLHCIYCGLRKVVRKA